MRKAEETDLTKDYQANEKHIKSRYIYEHSMRECKMHKEGKIGLKSRYDIIYDIGSAFLFATIKEGDIQDYEYIYYSRNRN